MSDYTHEDYERDKATVVVALAFLDDDEAGAFGRILAHHAAQLTEVRAKDEKVAKDALRDCALGMGIRCKRCPVSECGCDDTTCEQAIADYYWQKAVERA